MLLGLGAVWLVLPLVVSSVCFFGFKLVGCHFVADMDVINVVIWPEALKLFLICWMIV